MAQADSSTQPNSPVIKRATIVNDDSLSVVEGGAEEYAASVEATRNESSPPCRKKNSTHCTRARATIAFDSHLTHSDSEEERPRPFQECRSNEKSMTMCKNRPAVSRFRARAYSLSTISPKVLTMISSGSLWSSGKAGNPVKLDAVAGEGRGSTTSRKELPDEQDQTLVLTPGYQSRDAYVQSYTGPIKQQFRQSALRFDVSRVKELIGPKSGINQPHRTDDASEPRFVTLLHRLCGVKCVRGEPPFDSLEVAKVLLGVKADVDPRSSEGCTPLIRACMSKNVKAAQLLLDHKADILCRNDSGMDPLRCSLVLNPPRNKDCPIDAAVDDVTEDSSDSSDGQAGALGRFSTKYQSRLSQLALSTYATSTRSEIDGRISAELVRVILVSGCPNAVKTLLSSDEDKVKSSESFVSPTLVGRMFSTDSLPARRKLKSITETGTSSLSLTDSLPLTSLASGAQDKMLMTRTASSSSDVVPRHSVIVNSKSRRELLADKSSKLKGNLGNEPVLLTAIKLQNHEAAQVLLEVGKVQPKYLHEAVELGSVKIVQLLLDAQADPSAFNDDGYSAMDLAFEVGGNDGGMLEALRKSVKMRGVVKEGLSMADPKGDLGSKRARTRPEPKFDSEHSDETEKRSGMPPILHVLGLLVYVQCFAEVAEPYAAKLRAACSYIVMHAFFPRYQLSLVAAGLSIADLWILAGISSESALDFAILIICFGFVAELFIQAVGHGKSYLKTFFFYMDIIGSLSLLLDLSAVQHLLLHSEAGGESALIMRAARAARLGARSGRLTRLVKLMRFLPGLRATKSKGMMKAITSKLTMRVTTMVSILLIMLAMGLPLLTVFIYPAQDYSMQMWTRQLAAMIRESGDDVWANAVVEWIQDFRATFEDKGYYPHSCTWTKGSEVKILWEHSGEVSVRHKFRVISGNIDVLFDFQGVHQIESATNLSMIGVMVCFLVGYALLISKSIAKIALQPSETLMSRIQKMTQLICEQADQIQNKGAYKGCAGKPEQVAECEHEFATEDSAPAEMHMLDQAVKKVVKLGDILKRNDPAPDDQIQILEYLGEASTKDVSSPIRISYESPVCKTNSLIGYPSSALDGELEALASWSYNALKVERTTSIGICSKLLQRSASKCTEIEDDVLKNYVETASMGYKGPQYHNWTHAVDVTHILFCMIHWCNRQAGLVSNLEEYALLVSAACHDIGHPGLNNDFLVKTSNELAICYNDHSPLENMHCARMFEITSKPRTGVFGGFAKEQYQEVRAICVAAILHTDNIHHMPMVKKLQFFGEVHSEALVREFDVYHKRREAESFLEYPEGSVPWPSKEFAELLWEADTRVMLRNSIFHFADINNTCRSWHICKEWAAQVLDEFFSQGDLEKQRGLPVGPLNDREKLDRASSQIGYIDFFAAPFVFATVRILPPLQELSDQIIRNTRRWVDTWAMQEPRSEEEVLNNAARLKRLEEKNSTMKSMDGVNRRTSVSSIKADMRTSNTSPGEPTQSEKEKTILQNPRNRLSVLGRLGTSPKINANPQRKIRSLSNRRSCDATDASSNRQGGSFASSWTLNQRQSRG